MPSDLPTLFALSEYGDRMSLVAGIDSSTQTCKVIIRDADSGELIREGRSTASRPVPKSIRRLGGSRWKRRRARPAALMTCPPSRWVGSSTG